MTFILFRLILRHFSLLAVFSLCIIYFCNSSGLFAIRAISLANLDYSYIFCQISGTVLYQLIIYNLSIFAKNGILSSSIGLENLN